MQNSSHSQVLVTSQVQMFISLTGIHGGIATQQFAWSGMHSAGDAPTTGDIIGVAADFDNRKFY